MLFHLSAGVYIAHVDNPPPPHLILIFSRPNKVAAVVVLSEKQKLLEFTIQKDAFLRLSPRFLRNFTPFFFLLFDFHLFPVAIPPPKKKIYESSFLKTEPKEQHLMSGK